MYSIFYAFTQYTGTIDLDWFKFFDSLLSFTLKTKSEQCQFNAFSMAILALCQSYRLHFFTKDDGLVALVQNLSTHTGVTDAAWEDTDAFEGCREYVLQCVKAVKGLEDQIPSGAGEMQINDVKAILGKMNNTAIGKEEIKKMVMICEQPKYTQFFHIYSRTH